MSGGCRQIVRSLGAYVDDQLPGALRLQVSEHLDGCAACTQEWESLRGIGDALRLRSSASNLDNVLAGLAGSVTSRIGAEKSQSWRATWNRIFDDWHWVGVGLGSVAGAMMTFVVASAMLVTSITQLERMNAQAGTLYLIALPKEGSQPVMLEFEQGMGTARPDSRVAMPASLGWEAERALVAALDEKMGMSGRTPNLLQMKKADREEILALLSEIAEFRSMEPSRRPGGLTNVSGMHLKIDTSVSAGLN
jgi:hypothetical protein